MENISVRFDSQTLERLVSLKHHVAKHYTAKSKTSRSDVLRTAILKGLKVLENECELVEHSLQVKTPAA